MHIVFGLTVFVLGGFLVFSQTLGMLSANGSEPEGVQPAHFLTGQGGRVGSKTKDKGVRKMCSNIATVALQSHRP